MERWKVYMKLDSLLAKPGTPLWRAFNSQWLGNENMDAFGELFVNNWNTRRVDMAPLYFGIFKDPHKESSVAHSFRLRKTIDKYLDDNHRDKEWIVGFTGMNHDGNHWTLLVCVVSTLHFI